MLTYAYARGTGLRSGMPGMGVGGGGRTKTSQECRSSREPRGVTFSAIRHISRSQEGNTSLFHSSEAWSTQHLPNLVSALPCPVY